MDGPEFKNPFLQQLYSIDVRSEEFANVLAKTLATQEGVKAAMSLQGEEALTLVDILNQVSRQMRIWAPYLIVPAQVFDTPNMSPELRRKSVRVLRSVCGLQKILPRALTLSVNITKERDIAFASGGFADVWKGRRDGNAVCIKAFRAYTAENLSSIKQVI